MNGPQAADACEGRVAVHFGADCLVEIQTGELIRCHVPRRLARPVCGDRVRWLPSTTPGQGVLDGIFPRRNELLRHDRHARQRVLAANIDRVLVMLAAKPAPDLALIDRYLVAAERLQLDACLVFNKSDLLDQDGLRHWQNELSSYARLDYRLVFTSLKTGQGVGDMRGFLDGMIGIVVGQSGVGKSSLVSALVPDLSLLTQKLSEASGTGRHTTSTTRLYPLPDHRGCIIDSPGVRDFRLWPLSPQELASAFREFRDAQGRCRFANCRHLQEPDCEIRRQVAAGEISARRYASYCQMAEWMGP